MQLAALRHECRAPLAYAVGDSQLRVIVKAAAGDVAEIVCYFGDRYAWPPAADAAAALAHLGDDGVHEYWGVTLPAPTRRVRYIFAVTGHDGTDVWLSARGPQAERPETAGFFEYAYIHPADAFQQPDWLREAVLYHVFPDRFCNGDPGNDPPETAPWGSSPTRQSVTGGDLAGIKQKLGYLHDLGVTCLYTTPLFQAPSNHKYDTQDYYSIDPVFGSNEELAALVHEAHAAGIRVLLDAVFNHAGSEWFAFRDVIARGEQSPYKDWFFNLHSFPVQFEACNYETFATGVATMPKLNTANPALTAYLLDVATHWLQEANIDGWRLDVANEVDHRFWRAFRDRVKSVRPDAFILGEVWHDATPWLQGDQFDSVMNYPWRDATLAFLAGTLDAPAYNRELTRQRFAHQAEVARGLVNLLGSHDTPRVRTVLGSRPRAAQAAVLLLLSPGVPMIDYGDEIGMEGGPDPGCRGCYPWHAPHAQDRELLALYRRLTTLRREHPWLNAGTWEPLPAPAANVLAVRRQPADTDCVSTDRSCLSLYVFVNNAPTPAHVSVQSYGPLRHLTEGFLAAGRLCNGQLQLPGYSAAVLSP